MGMSKQTTLKRQQNLISMIRKQGTLFNPILEEPNLSPSESTALVKPGQKKYIYSRNNNAQRDILRPIKTLTKLMNNEEELTVQGNMLESFIN